MRYLAIVFMLLPCVAMAQGRFESGTGNQIVVPMGPGGSGPVPVTGTISSTPNTATLGTYVNGSATLSTATVQIYAAASTRRYRIVLFNYDATNDIWCRWGTIAAAPAAVSGIGSFKVAANGGGRNDSDSGVNQSALNCIASAGTPILYAEQY